MDRFLVRPAKAARIEKPLRDPRTLLSWNSNGLPVQMRKNWPEVASAVFFDRLLVQKKTRLLLSAPCEKGEDGRCRVNRHNLLGGIS